MAKRGKLRESSCLARICLARCASLHLLQQNRRGAMPMTNAQRQKLYRERHRNDLGHITLDVHVAVRDRLDRLAWDFQWSVTQLVEELASRAELAVEAELSGTALKAYRDAGYEDTA
jgi:hypothetical protein